METDSLKSEFAKIDVNDGEALRQFFLKYNCFTTSDWVTILHRSPTLVRKYKRRAGFRQKSAPSIVPPAPPRPPVLGLDPFEDTAEWWQKQYSQYGRLILQRASGLSATEVRKRITQHCKWRSLYEANRSKHSSCNEKWLTDHYVTRGLTISKCAELAGVSDDTIKSWLVRFKFEIRQNSHGSVVGKNCS